MNRQEALDWCVGNLVVWGAESDHAGWYWEYMRNNKLFFLHVSHERISEQDWLDAKADKDKDMIDWTNAPEEADRYVELHELQYSKEYKGFAYKNNLGNYELIDSGTWIDKVDVEIMRPTEQPYMPEIGELCEYLFGSEPDAFIGSVQAFSGDSIWFKTKDGMFKTFHGKHVFRPIKTERENLINDAAMIVEMKHGSAGSAYKKYVTTLYDAGFIHAPTT